MKVWWLILLVSGSVMAEPDIEAGKHKALICQNCHGEQGISDIDLYPNLAGQKQLYLKVQLLNFKNGQRPSAVMAPMASALSDQDIDNLAAYYASL